MLSRTALRAVGRAAKSARPLAPLTTRARALNVRAFKQEEKKEKAGGEVAKREGGEVAKREESMLAPGFAASPFT